MLRRLHISALQASSVALLALPLLLLSTTALAVDLSFKLEPGVAIPLSAPQSQIYDVGGGQSVKLLFGLTPYLDIGPVASFMLLPAAEPLAESGVVWGLGGGLRLKRPHDESSYSGASPWFDADLMYIRTGDLNRPGFDAALGVSVPLDDDRVFWVGPFVRYLHVIQPVHEGADNRDAKVLSIGISLEVGSGVARPAPVPVVAAAEPAREIVRIVNRDVAVCADLDKDGVPDVVDRCPDVAGGPDNWGCPNYKKIVIQRDKLELKEKLYFAWNQAKLEDASFPVLDEVVQALKDNKGFRVQIEGHTDSTGPDDHNQTLSEKRAQAVLDYLVSHGVPSDRLVSKGFSSSVPLDSNKTVSGREANRRVEFVVQFNLLNPGSEK